MRNGVKPQPKKVHVILAITPPKLVKDLQRFLGMCYQDLWARLSRMLAPHTSLVGECGHAKATRANKTKKCPWHWEMVHQKAFDDVKATIAMDLVLAYPDYSIEIEIYTDTLSKQLGSVITQGDQPLVFFSKTIVHGTIKMQLDQT
ncbi:LOW QUALITY PROTEIN: hypothetical protein ACHAW6_001249 [Cyclotella cf. meneghiniana]